MINLLFKDDIVKLLNKNTQTPDEYFLSRFHQALETKVQQECHTMFNQLAFKYEQKFGGKVMEFVQLDNGGKMGFKQKAKKKAEGTKKGIPDTVLFCGSPCGQYSQVILVEFKRIGVKSEIKISNEQLHYHNWFNSIGFKSYITNNPLFFRDVILQDVKDFYKNNEKTIL